MAAVFIFGETLRRGIGYFSINATTMIEDYLFGLLLLIAAILFQRGGVLQWRSCHLHGLMATGSMFIPIAAHLEAWLRGETFRPDHPRTRI